MFAQSCSFRGSGGARSAKDRPPKTTTATQLNNAHLKPGARKFHGGTLQWLPAKGQLAQFCQNRTKKKDKPVGGVASSGVETVEPASAISAVPGTGTWVGRGSSGKSITRRAEDLDREEWRLPKTKKKKKKSKDSQIAILLITSTDQSTTAFLATGVWPLFLVG